VLQEAVVGVVGLVVLALPGVVLGHLEQVGGVAARGVLEREPGQRLVEETHLAREALDDPQRHGGVALDEQAVLVAVHGNQRHVREGEGGLDVAVRGHRRDDPKKPPGARMLRFLLDDLDFLADPDLAAADDVEAVRALLSLDDDVGVAVEIDDRKLQRVGHRWCTGSRFSSI